MLKRVLTATITGIILTSSLGVTTVCANPKTIMTQAELPPGYGIESGKVTKNLLDIKLASLKDDIKTGNTANLDRKVAKVKEYLEEAIANKEINEKEAQDLRNEINELAKMNKNMEKIEPSDKSKIKPNNKKQEKLVKTGSSIDARMLMQIGATISLGGAFLIRKTV